MNNQLLLQIDDLKDKQRQWQEEYKKTHSAYQIGLWGILIGLLLIPAFGIGLIIAPAGALAAFTNYGKRKHAKEQLAYIQTQITALRQQLTNNN